jgi:hypothetical protein
MIDHRAERALSAREAAETPEARAARRANDWFVTYRRILAAADRVGIIEEQERIRFVCGRLWPELDEATIERLVAHTVAAGGLRPADRADDLLGPRLATLMRRHGYRTQ